MGYSNFNAADYHANNSRREAAGINHFEHHQDIQTGKVAKGTHQSMLPFRVTRESRDSDAHPESNAVAVLFDVTGSMHAVPRAFQSRLAVLMTMLVDRGYLPHPQVMTGAIGDATCDISPLQVGQFESGLEIDSDLSHMYLEAGGGGQQTESYELGAYFMARHTSIDCFEKRQKRGYLFILGDEMCYPTVSRDRVLRLIGDELPADIPTATLFEELRQRYDVFYVLTAGTAYYEQENVRQHWRGLVGDDHMLLLSHADMIAELVVGAVGVSEGYSLEDICEDLASHQVSDDGIEVVRSGLAALATSRAPTRLRDVIRT
jgi:hypothetical protein